MRIHKREIVYYYGMQSMDEEDERWKERERGREGERERERRANTLAGIATAQRAHKEGVHSVHDPHL